MSSLDKIVKIIIYEVSYKVGYLAGIINATVDEIKNRIFK